MEKIIKSFTPDVSSGGPFQEEYFNEKLWMYIKNLWEDPAKYKILMARRMLNLNDVLMRGWDSSEKEQYLTDGIMSNTAFLLAANAIADQYAQKKCFPRILICDDIMLHGRGIINLLEKFRRIVMSRLAEKQVEINEKQLKWDLNRAVSIYVFARNRDEGLLIDEKVYRIYAVQILPMNRLRELSLQISDYLFSCGVANTSYVISVKLSGHQVGEIVSVKNAEPIGGFRYKGRYQNVFFRERSANILETMRIHYPNGNPKLGGVLTSLPIFGDVSGQSFERLCRITASYMEQNVQYSQIAKYLRQERVELIKPKAQLISFLYSILSIADFCRQKLYVERGELFKILVSGDFNKIITNFDNGDVFQYEILNLFKDVCATKLSGNIMWEFLEQIEGDAGIDRKKQLNLCNRKEFRSINGPDKSRRREKYEDVEDIFYEVGMDAEYDAFRYIWMKKPFDVNRPGFDLLSFRQYMHLMKCNNIEHSIGCLFGLMDSGLISMNLEADNKENLHRVCTVLKAGEMATYVLPRRFYVFIPALALVESWYSEEGSFIRYIISDFIDFLQNYCYTQGGSIDLRDRSLLEALMNKKPLLLYLYSAGQKFQDWDIDLRNERKYEERRVVKDEDELTYEEERVRKSHYLLVAREFVKQYIMNSNKQL